jgi:hypothetical protein
VLSPSFSRCLSLSRTFIPPINHKS